MTIDIEKFFSVPGFGGNYKIDICGRIISFIRNKPKILKNHIDKCGYYYVNLVNNKKYKIHRLIALTFIPNPHNKPCVNHKNGIKTDNRIENLEWCTYSENNKHAYDTGLRIAKRGKDHYWSEIDHRGSKHPNSKLNEDLVREIKHLIKVGDLSNVKIAKIYNVSQWAIGDIKNGRSWNFV